MHSKCGLRFEKNRGSSYAKLVLQKIMFCIQTAWKCHSMQQLNLKDYLGSLLQEVPTHALQYFFYYFLNNVNIYDNKKPL